jgi:hypothetical protein
MKGGRIFAALPPPPPQFLGVGRLPCNIGTTKGVPHKGRCRGWGGKQDCGKPYYETNYRAFYEAIKAVHPHMRLIANCELGKDAPSDLWDWHWYTDPVSMFRGRHVFDEAIEGPNGLIFASEYAVFDWGIPTAPAGNLAVRAPAP